MTVDRWLRIEYLDGTDETFTFPKQAKDEYDFSVRFREILSADRIVLESEGQLHIIPLSAVKRLDFSPAPSPQKLPDQVIKGVTRR